MEILVVDDDPQVIAYVTKVLNRWGHTSRSAGSGKEALELFSSHSFDLILLDIFLPDTMAYELIPRFRAVSPGIGIVTMTGNSSRELELKIREKGILYYMVKPIEAGNLKLLLDHIGQRT